MLIVAAALACAAGAAAFAGGPSVQQTSTMPDRAAITKMRARFAPVDIKADVARLAPGDRRALAKLVEAARIMDALFLRQVWAGNPALLQQLSREALAAGPDSPAAAQLHYFLINAGPWSRLDHHQPFVAGVPAKPEGANFYPADATKEEVQKWIDSLSGDAKAQATGFFTAIRRGSDRALSAVPYSVEYQGELGRAAALLREAADATTAPSLKKFLTARADAFLSNDYYASDIAWMELDAPVEPTIGPYEVYEDEWFNFKAAFEAFITVRDDAESAKLQTFSKHLQSLENALPIDAEIPQRQARRARADQGRQRRAHRRRRQPRRADRGLQPAERRARHPRERQQAGDAQERAGRQVPHGAACPSPRWRCRRPIRSKVSFDAFFTHILMHELMHGLGPHNITVGGRATTVRQELKETYSTIEEAKADVSGLWALAQLAADKSIDPAIARTMYTTFLASAFRSIRFGLNEAHGRGIAIQLNYLLDAGAFRVNGDGTFAVDETKIAGAVTALTREIMTLQAEGSYEKAKTLIEKLGVVRPQVQKLLDRLTAVPVDIEPRFTSADTLAQ